MSGFYGKVCMLNASAVFVQALIVISRLLARSADRRLSM
jgi:hypothetical protein